MKFGKLGAAWRHQLNWQALISGVVVSCSIGRALAMKAGDPGLSPGSAKNFLGRGHWHTLVIQLLDAVVSSSVGRALAMKSGDLGSSPGLAKNFSGRGYWHILVIKLIGGPEV